MKNDRVATLSSDPAENLYPHMKITAERFPRVLATRRIEDDGAEYFGPFLPRTSARILIDFLERVFSLRTCDIGIDGNFPVPCTQYYRKRCVAPCVASICGEQRYLERVDLVREFLANDRDGLRKGLENRIHTASDELEFELAAKWRDMLAAVDKWWSNQRLEIWLDRAVDTITVEETGGSAIVYLVTHRDRYVLGRKVFTFPCGPSDEALRTVITNFYPISLPHEIRVYREFEGRKGVETLLSKRFKRDVRLKLVRRIDQRITARRALHVTRSENELDRIRPHPSPDEISAELQRIFHLHAPPKTIRAFDVAHISGSHFVAASSYWQEGEFASGEAHFEISEQTSELRALAHAVSDRDPRSDLILLDGGRSQLNAVMKQVPDNDSIVAAVKPRGKHSQVSHFLTIAGSEVGFDPDNPAHAVLQLLRDEAHDLANRVHRDLRDMGHHYELAALLPSLTESERRDVVSRTGTIKRLIEMQFNELSAMLPDELSTRVVHDLGPRRFRHQEITTPFIVPIRYSARNGNADDLIPIEFS